MKIKFLGAAGTVTGSSYVLTSNSNQSILIDLGLFQGPPKIDSLNYLPLDYDCSHLIGAVLTHAHLDHCGRLPILMSHGFSANIYMTPPTSDLTKLSLLDSAKIAKEDHRQSLFDKEQALKTFARFKTVDYHTPFNIGDFTIIMRDAGHILGSASLEISDGKNKIVFSGDLGNSPEDLLKATETFDSAAAVVMESTYGDRLHPAGDPADFLQSEMHEIEQSGGTILIPAFSLERTQELLHLIKHLKSAAKISPTIPIYMDSPMAQKATDIYLEYPEIFNAHIQSDLKSGDPFDFPGLTLVAKREDSQAIHATSGPKVIIAGSGMMTGGRITGHAAHYLPFPTTRLLIVGYQGEGTLGRQLLEGSKKVIINKATIPVLATVSSNQTMSSHADQLQLLTWLKHIQGVKQTFLTHGEDDARKALADKISQDLGLTNTVLPTLNQEANLSL